MNSANFQLSFGGPALSAGEMEIRELASTLLTISDLLKSANKALHGDRAEVAVSVCGSFTDGAFGVDFSVSQKTDEDVKDIFADAAGATRSGARSLIDALGLNGGGLIGLLRALGKRRPDRIEATGNGFAFVIGDERVVAEQSVFMLFNDPGTRLQMQETLKPLEREGIDNLTFGRGTQVTQFITRGDRAWFDLPDPNETALFEDTGKIMLSIESASFKEGNKWRLSDGTTTFHAEILDTEFLGRIESGDERFGKGDQLVVELRRSQFEADGKLRTDYAVMTVLEHRASPQRRLI